MYIGDHDEGRVDDALEHLRDADRDRARARELRAEADALEARAEGEDLEAERDLDVVRHDDGDHGGTLTIVVNGREKEVERGTISYEQVIVLAFGTSAPAVSQTVNWRRRDGEEGSLLPGESVRLREGMIFNASATNRS